MNENTKPLFSFTKFTLKHLLFLFIYPIIFFLNNKKLNKFYLKNEIEIL